MLGPRSSIHWKKTRGREKIYAQVVNIAYNLSEEGLSSRLQKNRCAGAPKSWCTGAPETDIAVSAITYFQKRIFNYFLVMHLGFELCEHWSTLNGVCCEDCRQWLYVYHYLRHCMSHNNMRIGDYSLPCNISALRACWHPNHYMQAGLAGVEVDDPSIFWWVGYENKNRHCGMLLQ